MVKGLIYYQKNIERKLKMYNVGVIIFNYFIVILTMIVLFKVYFKLANIEEVKSKFFLKFNHNVF